MLLIWWTNNKDCEIIGRKMSENTTRYIYDQYLTRVGRNGEGRVWASDEKEGHYNYTTIVWPTTEFANQIRNYYGGIVIDAKHYNKCPYGVFTDNKITQYSIEQIEEILRQEKEQGEAVRPIIWLP